MWTVVHALPDPHRGIVSFIELAGMDQLGLYTSHTPEQFLDGHIAFTEWNYQLLDSITRRTGRLTKCTRLMDLTGLSFAKMHRGHVQRDAANSHYTEDYYPQLLLAGKHLPYILLIPTPLHPTSHKSSPSSSWQSTHAIRRGGCLASGASCVRSCRSASSKRST